MANQQHLSSSQSDELLSILKDRFLSNLSRHPEIQWDDVEAKLRSAPEKLLSLHLMETSGGEPDVVVTPESSGAFTFYDCSAESPKGRRSICYDHEALESRKEHKPADSAVNMASSMGIELLSESEYRELQQFGKFDLKTSSWIKTPPEIRKLKGALFCDRRYETVFLYHNGAESYYGARGFRGKLIV